ncbi:hypothetical protein JL722_10445 [Aureococcus anophagefferens]|nr:hypothetical protein JL722_10445 [Aureococcus anophagefferens]
MASPPPPQRRKAPRSGDRVVDAYLAQLRRQTKALSLDALVMPVASPHPAPRPAHYSPYAVGATPVRGDGDDAAYSLAALLTKDENASPERRPPSPERAVRDDEPLPEKPPAPPSDRRPLAPASLVQHETIEHPREREDRKPDVPKRWPPARAAPASPPRGALVAAEDAAAKQAHYAKCAKRYLEVERGRAAAAEADDRARREEKRLNAERSRLYAAEQRVVWRLRAIARKELALKRRTKEEAAAAAHAGQGRPGAARASTAAATVLAKQDDAEALAALRLRRAIAGGGAPPADRDFRAKWASKLADIESVMAARVRARRRRRRRRRSRPSRARGGGRAAFGAADAYGSDGGARERRRFVASGTAGALEQWTDAGGWRLWYFELLNAAGAADRGAAGSRGAPSRSCATRRGRADARARRRARGAAARRPPRPPPSSDTGSDYDEPAAAKRPPRPRAAARTATRRGRRRRRAAAGPARRRRRPYADDAEEHDIVAPYVPAPVVARPPSAKAPAVRPPPPSRRRRGAAGRPGAAAPAARRETAAGRPGARRETAAGRPGPAGREPAAGPGAAAAPAYAAVDADDRVEEPDARADEPAAAPAEEPRVHMDFGARLSITDTQENVLDAIRHQFLDELVDEEFEEEVHVVPARPAFLPAEEAFVADDLPPSAEAAANDELIAARAPRRAARERRRP